jgi:hypothetical protein
MRDILALLEGRKLTVEGTVSLFSSVHGYAGRRDVVLCLADMRTAEGEPLTDHLWVRCGKRIKALDLRKGDRAAFTATVERYSRAAGGEDFGLVRPYQCRVLERAALPTVVQESPQLEGQESPDLVVPNPRGAILPPVKTLPYSQARELLLARIDVLQAETGTAPSLPRLRRRMAMPARMLLTTLHQLARDGQILFTPNGTVMTAPQKGIYA